MDQERREDLLRNLARAEDHCRLSIFNPDREDSARMAREALAVSDLCSDAWRVLAWNEASSPQEELHFYERGLEAAERRALLLYESPEPDERGGYDDAYAAVRVELARCLETLGRREDAAEHCRALLRILPEDPWRVRYILARLLLAIDDPEGEAGGGEAERPALEELLRLARAYPEDYSTRWAYTSALAHLRRFGAATRKEHRPNGSPSADGALLQALAENPRVAPYLLGRRPLPQDARDAEEEGDLRSEAAAYAAEAAAEWRRTPGAVSLLGTLYSPSMIPDARLYTWREPAGEDRLMAAFKDAYEALLGGRARDLGLDAQKHAVPEGFAYFTVAGDPEAVAELAEGLLEDNESDFEVLLEDEEDAELFYHLNIEPRFGAIGEGYHP